jgi:hypothetical protein
MGVKNLFIFKANCEGNIEILPSSSTPKRYKFIAPQGARLIFVLFALHFLCDAPHRIAKRALKPLKIITCHAFHLIDDTP